MNETEKKAIELLKQPLDLPFIYCERENAIRIVLKLIEKQQKEIKGSYHKGFIDGRISMKYEAQDKIREKIKELVSKNVELLGLDKFYFAIEILKELL